MQKYVIFVTLHFSTATLTVHLHEGTRLSGQLAKQQWLAHDADCTMQPRKYADTLYASKSHMFSLSKC